MTQSCASSYRARDSNDTSADLIEFDGLEECLEIAFAETLVSLALDDFEEDGPDHVRGEDLQQDAFGFRTASIDENAALAQFLDVLLVADHPVFNPFVIRFRRVLGRDAAAAQHVDGLVDVFSRQRDVLDALAA